MASLSLKNVCKVYPLSLIHISSAETATVDLSGLTIGKTAAEELVLLGAVSYTHLTRIQGLPADVYAAHPNWTEDFLTVNEYSRPGDPLTEVKNIFVRCV